MALTFNAILQNSGIDPSSVRLLRHCDPRVQRQVFQAAIAKDPRFDRYQAAQGDPRVIAMIKSAKHIAGFVVDEAGDSVFVGTWQVLGPSRTTYDPPFVGMAENTKVPTVFATRRVDDLDLDLYRGRLVVDWGPGQRAWVQRAEKRDKPIIELRRQIAEPAFPGYLSFQCALSEIEALPRTWIAALRACGGVYLLVHRERANVYVGSAAGADGFFGRWRSYQDGHGGNVAMRELDGDAKDYDVSILETAGSGQDEHAILRLEERWKVKLGSRLHGLNRN